ncbi:lipopolysaccharide heptosyltransferase I [Endozoicomonas sp. (ex Bugula neritina AB1)]|nr:lipopolysaccharide heptosyltransferase I [Endozoicomonas sp. (ex Bugula neritina AB1)]
MKVLIVKTSSLGDVIHTLPALTDAAKAIPSIRFDWVVEENFAEIPSWHPAVDKVIPVAIRRWRKSLLRTWRSGEWSAFKKTLSSEKYDAIIDAQGLVKSAFLTRKAQGSTFGLDKDSAREPFASRFYDHPQTVSWDQHAVERIRQLFASSLGYTLPEHTGHFQLDKSHFDTGLIANTPYVVFLHGTTWPTKHWPENYWSNLAAKVNSSDFHVVLPWGNGRERVRAELIASTVDHATVLPKLSLAGVAGVITAAKAVVSVDTGLGHLTAALETPAVSLYGPTNPKKVGAYGANQIHLTLNDCPKDTYPQTDPELFAPMTPDFVFQSLKRLLSPRSLDS